MGQQIGRLAVTMIALLAALMATTSASANADDNDTAHHLTGRTVILNIFVNDTDGDGNPRTWNATKRAQAEADLRDAMALVAGQAPLGANLEIGVSHVAVTIAVVAGGGIQTHWVEPVMAALRVVDEDFAAFVDAAGNDNDNGWLTDEACRYVKKRFAADNAVVIFSVLGSEKDKKIGQPSTLDDEAQQIKGAVIFMPRVDILIGRLAEKFLCSKLGTPSQVQRRVQQTAYAHEFLHLFAACDEYGGSKGCGSGPSCQACANRWIAAAVPEVDQNRNCELCAATQEKCIMAKPWHRLPLACGGICGYTRRQIGWGDCDGDGIPDALDRRAVSGRITSGQTGDGVVGAAVSLREGDAREYGAFSALDGMYHVEITAPMNPGGSIWTLAVSADGFEVQTAAVSFPDGCPREQNADLQLDPLGAPNHPPVCNAGGPYTATCQGPLISIQLDGTGSSDADAGDVLTYLWTSDCPGASFDYASSPTPILNVEASSPTDVSCGVTLTVSDGKPDGQRSCDATVNVAACNRAMTWIVPPPPPPIHGEQLTVYDALRARLLVVIPDTNMPRVWTRGTAPGSGWSFLATTNDAPYFAVSRVILDPVRDRLLVLSLPGGSIWSLSLSGAPTWTEIPTSGITPGLFGQSVIYDSRRDRIVAFAGTGGNCTFPDCRTIVWTLSLSGPPTWEELTVQGPAPASRRYHFAAYDAVDDRMIVYGGDGCCSGALNDLWSLSFADPATWSQVPVVGPGPGARAASLAYDSARRRLLLFGGSDGSFHDDLWALSLTGTATWTLLDGGGTGPSPRQGAGCAYDSEGDRLLLVGGGTYTGTSHNDLWAFPLDQTGWQSLETNTPWPGTRWGHSADLDIRSGRILIAGGFFPQPMDVWSLTLGSSASWTQLSPSGQAPAGRYDHGAAYDPTGDQLIIFGGQTSGPSNEVWRLSFGGTAVWEQLSPAGTPPSPRSDAGVVLDPVRRRLLVIGGTTGAPNSSTNDVWALNLDGTPTWTELAPAGLAPTPLCGHSATYDPVRDRVVVFGGTLDYWSYGTSATLELRLSPSLEWQQLTPGNSPPGRYHHTAVYDPGGDQLIIFGGVTYRAFYADTWALPLREGGEWTQLAPSNGGPGLLENAAAVHDPASGRMVLFGGNLGGAPSRELWILDMGRSPIPVQSGAPVAKGTRAVQEASPPKPMRLLGAMPNPSQGTALISFEVPGPNQVDLRIYDLIGREIWHARLGPLPAGRHSVAWGGRGPDGAPASPGVYFVDLRAGGRTMTRRFVLVR